MLRFSYTLLSPIYDLFVAPATHKLRKDSLARLTAIEGNDVLLCGVGSGLDIPCLANDRNYIGMDLTPAMLKQAENRLQKCGVEMQLYQGDAMHLPHKAQSFDIVILHLILAVVPKPYKVLAEASRVLKPQGHILILDKFLRPDEKAFLKRSLNMIMQHIATRTDVVFEDLIAKHTELIVKQDKPVLLNGWFREILLQGQ